MLLLVVLFKIMKLSITIFIFLLQAWFISILAMNETHVPADSSSKKNYPMFGITFGLPGGFYMLFGSHFGNLSIRGEISFPSFGLNTSIGYNLLNSKSSEINLSIVGGYINFKKGEFIKRSDWTYSYFGACIDFNGGGVFFELGLKLIQSELNFEEFPIFGQLFGGLWAIAPLIQLGYVYRFNE